MKGPGLRHDLDVRRLWRCPQCQREIRYLGDVVALKCTCADPAPWMHLITLPRKPAPKFEKITIPLSEQDLIVRDRPPRIPDFLLPPPEGAEPAPNDRRNLRGRRPRPGRFERTEENAPEAETAAESPPVEQGFDSTVTRKEQLPPPAAERQVAPEPSPPEDDFASGLE